MVQKASKSSKEASKVSIESLPCDHQNTCFSNELLRLSIHSLFLAIGTFMCQFEK